MKNPSVSSISINLTNKELPLIKSNDTSSQTITISNKEMIIPREPHPYIRIK